MRWCVVAVLCAILAGCRSHQSQSLHIPPALESLVPADAVMVAGANLDQIRNTPVYEKLMSRLPLPQLDEFTRQTGLDPRKDISQFLMCSDGKRPLAMARGKFHPADLESRLESKGAARFTYKDHRLFGNEQGAVFFLDDATAIAGPAADLRSIIDHKSGRGLPPALRDLLRALPADDQIYAAFTGGLQSFDLPIPRTGNFQNFAQALQSVDSATLGINVSHGIDALALINCKRSDDAKFVHDMLKGLVGFGRLNTPDNQPELLKLYDGIQVTQDQAQAKITADIPVDLTDRFLEMLTKR